MAMKRNILSAAVLSLAFGACSLAANSSGSLLLAPQSGQSAAQEQSKDQVRAFTGTIAKTGDKFVLRDDTNQTLFDLDDQTSAGKFAGRKVKVTGTLDAVNNTIHIQTIEQASA
jgi:gas vesicle protein